MKRTLKQHVIINLIDRVETASEIGYFSRFQQSGKQQDTITQLFSAHSVLQFDQFCAIICQMQATPDKTTKSFQKADMRVL